MKTRLNITVNEADKRKLQDIAYKLVGTTNISLLIRHIANNTKMDKGQAVVSKK